MVVPRSRFLPMKTAGTHHFIERTYREGGAYQWVRETCTNAREAGATRIEFGIEWQAVDNLGVYRRTIADNGRGMTPEELVEFFNTFGGGGKPIGGVHENFGVGAKTSLLPWNRFGLVVISWVDGEPAMIWVHQDPESREFGLKVFEAEDSATGDISMEAVIAPFFDEELGCDWAAVRPDWITDHGTVLILLGNEPEANTVLGDPTREEADIKGISTYLNRRFWTIPDEVEIYVDELRTTDRAKWPRSEEEAHGAAPKAGYDRRTNSRRILGGHHYITYPVESFKKGGLLAKGELTLNDRTVVHWYLWEGERPAVQSYAAISGYIAALYENELYDQTSHASTYRSFGVSESRVRQQLWIIVEPLKLDDSGRHGVYPRTDRNALLLKGGPKAGTPLPLADWGAEFSEMLPEEILRAIRAARGDSSEPTSDDSWRDRLIEKYGHLWRLIRLRRHRAGDQSLSPAQRGTASRPRRIQSRSRQEGTGGGGRGGRSGEVNTGSHPGFQPARQSRVTGGIPTYRLVHADDIEEGMLASLQRNDHEHPEGVVLLNIDHPVMEQEIERWQSKYADHKADEVRMVVIHTYGEVAVAKVAHSEQLKRILPADVVEKKLRSNEALTMALLGLIAEEAVLATRIGGKFGRKRSAS